MKIILLLFFVISCAQAAPKYNRKEWNYGRPDKKTCMNTRNKLLKERSLVPVVMNKSGCSVKEGKWNDYYYPEVHTLAAAVQMDHLIPLKHAHVIGGWKWNKKQKKAFANDPENLVITNSIYNQEKKDKLISEWVPSDKTYACKYWKDWLKLKKKYSLSISEAEKNSVKNIQNCSI